MSWTKVSAVNKSPSLDICGYGIKILSVTLLPEIFCTPRSIIWWTDYQINVGIVDDIGRINSTDSG